MKSPLPMATDVQINKLSPLDPRGVSGSQTWLAGKSSINGDCPASHMTDYRSVCHCNRIQPTISRDINNKPKISAPKMFQMGGFTDSPIQPAKWVEMLQHN